MVTFILLMPKLNTNTLTFIEPEYPDEYIIILLVQKHINNLHYEKTTLPFFNCTYRCL